MKKQYENPDMEIIQLLREEGGNVLTLSETESSTGDEREWGQFF